MRFISRKFHAVFDYLSGILLIASPWLFNFEEVESAKWVAIAVGALILGLSFITDYEVGGKKVISMSRHSTMDVITGLFLAASPWLFNFDEYVYLPQLIFGITQISAGLFTERTSEHLNRRHVNRNISPAH